MGQSGYSCLKDVNAAESDSVLIVKYVIAHFLLPYMPLRRQGHE